MKTVHIAGVLALLLAVWYYGKAPDERHILADKVADEYDYIIVGGGSAGAVVASRLSEDTSVTVLLLEAGEFYADNPSISTPTYWTDLMLSPLDWQYYTEPQTLSSQGMKGKRSYWPRGRVLGGTSVLNSMQYNRGSPFDYDEWAAGGCTGWSYKEVLPYFLKSEDIQIPELKSSKFHSSGGPLSVSSGQFSPLADVYMQAGQELGYDIVDTNSDSPDGFSIFQLNTLNGVRMSTGFAFLGHTSDRKNIDISINSLVTKIGITQKTATGVYFIKHGRKQFVKARKEIILSAGTINSPQLLLLSGIGPKKHLTEMGIPTIADLPVGENLQDHQMLLLRNQINKPLSRDMTCRDSWWYDIQYILFGTGPKTVSGLEVTAFMHKEDTMKGKTHPDYWMTFASFLIDKNVFNFNETIAKEYFGFGKKHPYGFTSYLVLTRPHSKGTIRLKSTDPFDHPIIDANFFSDNRDMETMIGQIRLWEKYMNTKAIKELGAEIQDMKMSLCSQYKFRSDAYWECMVRHVAVTVYHHSGTCKMGAENDPTAVVDPQLRVRGIRGLRIADASIFPNVTSGNTNAPAIMVGEKAADLILGKDTVAHFRRFSADE